MLDRTGRLLRERAAEDPRDVGRRIDQPGRPPAHVAPIAHDEPGSVDVRAAQIAGPRRDRERRSQGLRKVRRQGGDLLGRRPDPAQRTVHQRQLEAALLQAAAQGSLRFHGGIHGTRGVQREDDVEQARDRKITHVIAARIQRRVHRGPAQLDDQAAGAPGVPADGGGRRPRAASPDRSARSRRRSPPGSPARAAGPTTPRGTPASPRATRRAARRRAPCRGRGGTASSPATSARADRRAGPRPPHARSPGAAVDRPKPGRCSRRC